MPLVLTPNPLRTIRPHLLPHPIQFSRIFTVERSKLAISSRIKNFRARCSNLTEGTDDSLPKEDEPCWEGGEWGNFQPWDVPWDWKVTACVMMPYLMSICLKGIVELAGQEEPQKFYSMGMLAEMNSTDEIAIKLILDQLLKSVAKLSVIYLFVCPHQPFPVNIFSFEWQSPFNLKRGWMLWSTGGLLVGSIAVFLVKAAISSFYAGQTGSEPEPLGKLLPLIGSSNISTICLVGTVGFLAPITEEILYRGFLLVSLTKWLPTPLAILASSLMFSHAHQSPGKSLEIFILGIILGLVYAQTRNLLAPITMHALWNSGVILLLTYLRSQGSDIQKHVS